MDPLNAVQRLMEAKGINPDTECTIEEYSAHSRVFKHELAGKAWC